MDNPGRDAPTHGDTDDAPPGGTEPEDARDEGAAPRHPWLRPLGFVAGGITLVALVIGGVLYWLHARHFETTDDAFIDGYSTQMAPQVSGRVTRLMRG